MLVAEFQAYSEVLLKEFMYLDIQERSLRYWDERGETQLCAPPQDKELKHLRRIYRALSTSKFDFEQKAA